MSDASLKNTTLLGIAGDLFGECTDLIEKELRLAKAEISENIAARLSAGMWMAASLMFGIIAFLLLIEGLIFFAVHRGVPPYIASFVAMAIVAIIGAALYAKGKAATRADLLPTKSIRSFTRDIRTAKEQLP